MKKPFSHPPAVSGTAEQGDLVQARARDAASLSERVRRNARGQQHDLGEWLFTEHQTPSARGILELCCGTGAQTRYLAARLAPGAQLVALDASAEALAKMIEAVPAALRARVHPVNARLEQIEDVLSGTGLTPPAFEWVFCAYGLYYSADVLRTMHSVVRWLRPDGVLTVVGPFAPNNGPLFELLEDAGVTIPEFVRYTSDRFMSETVVPFVARAFEKISITTLVNPVTWRTPEDVLGYWRNTTFYAADREAAVRSALERRFERASGFINEKWIMRLHATEPRS